MGTPIEFTEAHEAMLHDNAMRLNALESHKTECDRLHEVHKDHTKRSGDAMAHLTDSNILLAKAVTELNITVTKLSTSVEDGRPVIEFWKNASNAWSFNKKIATGIVSLALGVIAIATAWNYFP